MKYSIQFIVGMKHSIQLSTASILYLVWSTAIQNMWTTHLFSLELIENSYFAIIVATECNWVLSGRLSNVLIWNHLFIRPIAGRVEMEDEEAVHNDPETESDEEEAEPQADSEAAELSEE